jgi:hypothetical protein
LYIYKKAEKIIVIVATKKSVVWSYDTIYGIDVLGNLFSTSMNKSADQIREICSSSKISKEDAGNHKIYVKMFQKICGNFFLSLGLAG